eukprot:13145105-Ditylum_brightwellii.AAC.1
MTQGNLTGRIIEKGAVITAYQPCKVSKKQGIMTHHQQVAMLQQDGRPLTPREIFITDITKWLEEEKKGELLIVGGDFNE